MENNERFFKESSEERFSSTTLDYPPFDNPYIFPSEFNQARFPDITEIISFIFNILHDNLKKHIPLLNQVKGPIEIPMDSYFLSYTNISHYLPTKTLKYLL
jgi:hypothetical protein